MFLAIAQLATLALRPAPPADPAPVGHPAEVVGLPRVDPAGGTGSLGAGAATAVSDRAAAAPAADATTAPAARSRKAGTAQRGSASRVNDTAGRPVARPAPVPAAAVAARTADRSVSDAARRRFEQLFPAQVGASQNAAGDPASTRWAVLIGINEHAGRTRDNVGSRQDAEDLAAHLLALGWRKDHVVLLRDQLATGENMLEAIAWLARKTDRNSVAVFHYSGHTKQWPGRDVDGDGEVPDEALWGSDNAKIPDRRFVRAMGAVDAGRLWVDIGACEAAGFMDPGLRRTGRVLTFSSREPEKSYEDPSVGNSVWGYFLADRGLRSGLGDRDGDGQVTVEEAFAYAAPRATRRTAQASHGPQRPVLVDDLRGDFSLRMPPAARRPSTPPGGGGNCLLICPP